MKRVFLIVLDSFGIGAMPDAADFGDEGSSTLKSVSRSEAFYAHTLKSLGLFHIDGVEIPGSQSIIGYLKNKRIKMSRLTPQAPWQPLRRGWCPDGMLPD